MKQKYWDENSPYCHFIPYFVHSEIIHSDDSLTNFWTEPRKYFAGLKSEILAVANSTSTKNELDLSWLCFSICDAFR